jgi:hypothetical protein
MILTSHSTCHQPIDRHDAHLELIVRTVLEQRELLPAMAANLQQWKTLQNLSQREQRLLEIVQDAIDAGYIRQIQVSPKSQKL